MLELLSHLLNLAASIVTLSSAEAARPPITTRIDGDHYLAEVGSKVIYRKETWYEQKPARSGKVDDAEYLLLEEMHGDGCPSSYTLLVVDEEGNAKTHSFGNCMEANITAGESWMEFTFEALEEAGRKAAKWKYEDGELVKVY